MANAGFATKFPMFRSRRDAVRTAILSMCMAACCCSAYASADTDTPDRVYDFTDSKSFTKDPNGYCISFENDEEFYGGYGLNYDSSNKCLVLDEEHEVSLPRYDSLVAKIVIYSTLDGKRNSSLSVLRTTSNSEIVLVKDHEIWQDDPYANTNTIEIPKEFDDYAGKYDITLKTQASPIYIQQMKVYFRESEESGQPSIVAKGCGYGDLVTVSAPDCSWIRVNVANKNGIGRERTVSGDKAELRLLEAEAFGGELTITATASPKTGVEIENSVTLTLPALSLTRVEQTPTFTPEDLDALTAPASFSYTFGATDGWQHYYAIKADNEEVNPYFDYIAYTEGTPIVGATNKDKLHMTGVNSQSSKYYVTTAAIGIQQPEEEGTCRYDAVTEQSEIRELEYGPLKSGRNAFYNYYVLAANDRSGNVAVMTDTRAATGYCAVRTGGTETIGIGTGAAEFGLVKNSDGTYMAIVSNGFNADPETTRDEALTQWLTNPNTHVLSHSDFEATAATAAIVATVATAAESAAAATADGWTVTPAGLSHDATHSIVYDAAGNRFACACTVAEADRIPTYLAANLKDKNGGLSTGINEILRPMADEDTEQTAVWYTLQGIRLEGAPTIPGLYVRTTPGTSRLHQVK